MRKLIILCTLLLASLLVACVPRSARGENEVNHLTSVGQVIYHQLRYVRANPTGNMLRSRDGGVIWEPESRAPSSVHAYFTAPPSFPITKCLSGASHLCYRVTGAAAVEKSTDGGRSWSVAWSSPAARHSFIQRFYDTFKRRCTNYSPNIVPRDLALTNLGSGRHLATVAMGNEGIIVLHEDGRWTRHAVECAEPTPYQTASLRAGLKATLWENLFLALAILLANPFYSRALTQHPRRDEIRAFLGKVPAYGGCLLSLLGLLLSGSVVGLCLPLFLLLSPLGILFGLLPEWSGVPTLGHSFLLLCLLLAALTVRWSLKPSVVLNPRVDVVMMIAAFLPFPLWAVGVIPYYSGAWALSMLSLCVIMGLAYREGYWSIAWLKGLLSTSTLLFRG